MKSKRIAAGLVATALAIGLLSMVPPRTAPAAEEPEMSIATTSAEHATEAGKLDQQAADLEAKAAHHAKEAAQYRAHATGGSKQAASFTSIALHCDRIAKDYGNAARELRAMASVHRDLAKGP